MGASTSPPASDRRRSGPPSPCPPWCDPASCTAADGGNHQSARLRVPATDNQVCAAEVWMTRPTTTDAVLFSVEVQYDPEFCAAFDVPTEPDAFVFSHGQARQLRRNLTRLLDAA